MPRRQAVPLAALALAWLLAGVASAGQAKPATKASAKPGTKAPAKKPPEPIHVWADRIRYQQRANRALIRGNVTIIKGDFRIDCDEVEALLEPGTNRFRKLTATGNVRMHTVKPVAGPARPKKPPKLEPLPDGRRAFCHKATYDPTAETVDLEAGDDGEQPWVQVGQDRLWGDDIHFDRKNNVVDVKGNVRFDGLVPQSSAPSILGPGPKPTPKPATKVAPK